VPKRVRLVSRGWGHGGGEWRHVVAFLAFDALSFGVTDVRVHADARRSAFHVRAFLRHLRGAVDQERQHGTACGHAVHLVSAFGGVHFAITGAFAFGGHGFEGHWFGHLAVGSWDAVTIGVLQESFFAEASNDALAGASWTRDWVGAGGRARGTARVEFRMFTAFWDRWEHHERFWLRNRRAFAGGDAFAHCRSQVSLFAGAALDADTRADGVGVLARAVASFALTEFFVVSAFLWWHRHGFGRWNAAGLGFHARAMFVLQETGFAEASDDAVLRADGARVGFGAGGCAGGSAREEHLVLFALAHFRRVGEEHTVGFLHGDVVVDTIAIAGWDAIAVGVLQESLTTETAHDALHGTHHWFFRIGAGRDAGRAAG